MPAKQPKDLIETFKSVVNEVNKIIVPAGNRESIEAEDKVVSGVRTEYEKELRLQRDRAKKDESQPLPFGMAALETHRGNCQEFAELTLHMLLQQPLCREVDYYICEAEEELTKDIHIFIVAHTHATPLCTCTESLFTAPVIKEPDDWTVIDSWSRQVYKVNGLSCIQPLSNELPKAKSVRGAMMASGEWKVQWTWDGNTLNSLPDFQHVKKWTPNDSYEKYSSSDLELTPEAERRLIEKEAQQYMLRENYKQQMAPKQPMNNQVAVQPITIQTKYDRSKSLLVKRTWQPSVRTFNPNTKTFEKIDQPGKPRMK